MQRFIAHFVLVLLFAFAQMAASVHEISHLNQPAQNQQGQNQPDQNHQDQNVADNLCGQCLGFAQMAGGVTSQVFTFFTPSTQHHPVFVAQYLVTATPTFSHLARAPPAKIV